MTNALPMRISVPICKVDEEKRLVYGIMSQEVVDHSGEILDYEGSKPMFEKWSADQYKASGGKSYGNVREMHTSIAAGKLSQPITFEDATKSIMCCSYVGDDSTWGKVKDGILTGFSIGGNYVKRWADPEQPGVMRYVPEMVEVSLVDAPCVPTATFEYIKANGQTEMRKFATTKGENPMAKTKPVAEAAAATETVEAAATETPAYELVQKWHAKDGSTWDKKDDARKRNAEVDAGEVAKAAAAPAMEALESLAKAVAATEGEGGEEVAKTDPAEMVKTAVAVVEGGGEELAKAEEALAAEVTAEAAPVVKRRLAKGMYSIGQLSDIICSLNWLQTELQWEKEWEGDESPIPDSLKASLKTLCDLLVNLAQEETAELVGMEKVALVEMAKGFKPDQFANLAKMVPAAAPLIEAMAVEAFAEEQNEPLSKANGEVTRLTAENVALTKAMGDLAPQISALQKRLEIVEAQPLEPKGTVRVVHKGAENATGGSGDAADVVAMLAAMPEDQRNMVVMKAALASPQIVQPGFQK